MSTSAAALARRAVACKGWRWMPRMREEEGATCVKVLDGQPWLWFVDDCIAEEEDDGEDCYPDLSDPATLGCMLALVREAWGRSGASPINIGTGWRVGDGKGWLGPVADSEAEALVSALEKVSP